MQQMRAHEAINYKYKLHEYGAKREQVHIFLIFCGAYLVIY